MPVNPGSTECSYDPGGFHSLLSSIIGWIFPLWKSENTKDNLLLFSCYIFYKIHISRFLNLSSEYLPCGDVISHSIWFFYIYMESEEALKFFFGDVFLLQRKFFFFFQDILKVNLGEEFMLIRFAYHSTQIWMSQINILKFYYCKQK